MGTNFYWTIDPDTMQQLDEDSEDYDNYDPLIHIGKRSAAGAYCYDCGVVLSKHGTQSVHSGQQLDFCPICYKTRQECGGTCSFTWTMMKHKRTLEVLAEKYPHFIVCRNEYDDKFTAIEMLNEVNECIIIFQDASKFG